MYISPPRLDVLRAIREQPLDTHQIAADLGQAPWLVRELVYGLRRDQLLTEVYASAKSGRQWALTPKGHEELYSRDQTQLEVA